MRPEELIAAIEAATKARLSHPERVALFVKEPGTGRHMDLPESDLIEETTAWLDRIVGPYPARHRATPDTAAYQRLWNAIKEKP